MTLARLFGEGRSPSTTVATSDSEVCDFSRLEQDVCRLAAALRSHGGAAGERWALVADDSYAFAVGLLGLWHAGCVAVSPPNAQPGTLERLGRGIAGVVGDAPGPAFAGRQLHPLRAAGGDEAPLAELDREAWAIELFTSGTSGDGRRVRKRLRHLEDEVAWLERRWGPALGDAEVFSTASHQHLYALLFRVLWPLAFARPFRADSVLHAEELVPRIAASGRACLVSTPAHLRRLVEHADVGRLRSACRQVFSSGAPLDPDTADRWSAALGAAPTEIFGSTETGGVAYRVQRPGRDRLAFTPFDGVCLERTRDGRLRVRSAYADGADGPDGLVMGDRVSLLPDGRFLLGGRADRTVKVGEKRLSLPEMEAELRSHADVRDAALLALELEGGARVAAVVVLGGEGRARLEREGRRALGALLAEHLATHFDRALLPRSWRFVEAIPEDAQGKRTAALLEALFDDRPGLATRPRILDEVRGEDRIERVLEVPAKLAFFDGHYPLFPVLPGVAQLAWAMDAAGALLGAEPALERIEALKFKQLVRPLERLHLAVERRHGGLAFRLWCEEREFASGRLVLRAPRGEEA